MRKGRTICSLTSGSCACGNASSSWSLTPTWRRTRRFVPPSASWLTRFAPSGPGPGSFVSRSRSTRDDDQEVDDVITATGADAAGVNGFPREDLEPAHVSDPERPEIDTANRGLDEMAADAWRAIDERNTPPRIFLYAGALTWLVADPAGRITIEVMNQDHVRHHLADVATFIRWTAPARGRRSEKKPAFPPVPLAADVLAVPRRTTLPRLQRLVHVPVFTADGRLLTAPGFDVASGLYFAPGLTLAPVSSVPSAEEITAARTALCVELLGDFPFVSDADRAHAVALLLTPLLRELVAGCVPLFVVSKPTPRTGAGLLTKVVAIVQGGSPSAAVTISRDEDEMRKRLTALLIPSPSMILLDNLHGRLDSAALAAILTTAEWEDRRLGLSQTIKLSVRTTFVVTGNNVALSNEMAGRSVLIRLDPKVEDPARSGGSTARRTGRGPGVSSRRYSVRRLR